MENDNDKRLKSVELELLKAFISCCNSLGIKYYLVEGSLIGAIRHNGFIPWDDDIDVALMRSDYELFISEGQKYLPNYYFVQSIDTEPNYLLNFAKIRDSRTTFIETSVKDSRINHGVYIDVFPLDYFTVDANTRKKFELKKMVLGWRIRRGYTLPKEYKGSFLKELSVNLLGLVVAIKYPTLNLAVRQRDNLYKSVPKSDYLTNHGSAWAGREIVPYEWYGEGTDAQFEGIKVRVPKEYDKLLRQVYGDYMQLPPPEKRVAHHYVEVIDLGKPYTEYFD